MTKEDRKGPSLTEDLSRFRQMVEMSAEEVYLVRPNGELVYVNEAAAAGLGYTRDEMLRIGVLGFDPLFGPRFSSHFEELKAGSQAPFETIHIAKDGRKVFKEMRSVYLNIEGNEYVCGFGRDITERKHAEEVLRAKTEELDRYFMGSLDLLCIASTDGYFLRLNPEWEKTLGYSLAELEGRRFLEFVHPDDVPSTLEVVSVLRGQREVLNFTNRYLCKDGSYRFIEWRSYPEGDIIYAVARDVTERKRMEDELRASEEKLRSIFSAAPTGIGLVLDRVIMEANEKLCEMTGYTKDELLGQNARMLYPTQEDYDYVGTEKYRQVRENGTGTVETRWQKKDGSIIDIILSSTPLDPGDPGKGVTFTVLDITQRKRAEEALRVTQFAIDHTADSVFWTDADSRFIYVNDTACRVLGYAREELLGMKVSGIDRDFSDDVWKDHWRELRKKRALVFETVHRAKDGRTFPVEMQTNFMEFGGREYNCAFARDITERKQAEEQRIAMERRLLQTQKLESLGVMAGGIAHDFNNLLMAILGNLDLALLSMSNVSPARLNIEQAIQATHTATDLTRQMLAYSGKGRFMISDIDVNELIEENAHLFRAALSRNVSITFQFENGINLISADAGQVQQVLMNLVTNASEAVGEKAGAVTLSTSAVDCGNEYLAQSRIEEKPRAGRFVCLNVRDTGCGMDRTVLDRIFDPFFSTKFTGRGLGMCAVMGIVRGHKGALIIESAVGEGTTVKVYFPAIDKTSKRIAAAGDVAEHRLEKERKTSPGRTVLVVDDEEMVREVCCAMLQELGFDVVAAEDGAQAVEIFRANAGGIDCVLLDLSMPKMDGLAAFQEISGLKPNVNVILVSGYNEQEAIQRFSAKGLAGFIQKPYRFEALRKELDKIFSP